MQVDWRQIDPLKFLELANLSQSGGGSHCSSRLNWQDDPTACKGIHPLPSSGQYVPKSHRGGSGWVALKLNGYSSLLQSLGIQVPFWFLEQKVWSVHSEVNLWDARSRWSLFEEQRPPTPLKPALTITATAKRVENKVSIRVPLRGKSRRGEREVLKTKKRLRLLTFQRSATYHQYHTFSGSAKGQTSQEVDDTYGGIPVACRLARRSSKSFDDMRS